MEVAGPLGTPLGLAQRKRASPRRILLRTQHGDTDEVDMVEWEDALEKGLATHSSILA